VRKLALKEPRSKRAATGRGAESAVCAAEFRVGAVGISGLRMSPSRSSELGLPGRK
jgi:hypothetical protein